MSRNQRNDDRLRDARDQDVPEKPFQQDSFSLDSENEQVYDFNDDAFNNENSKELDYITPSEPNINDNHSPIGVSPKTEIRINLGAPIICSANGIGAFIQGGVIGGVVGSVQGLAEGYRLGILSDPGFPRQLGAIAGSQGFTFGIWLGTFSATKCALRAARGKKDIVNSFGAGFAAGFVSSMHTRSTRAMVVSGITSGVLISLIDSLQGFQF